MALPIASNCIYKSINKVKNGQKFKTPRVNKGIFSRKETDKKSLLVKDLKKPKSCI